MAKKVDWAERLRPLLTDVNSGISAVSWQDEGHSVNFIDAPSIWIPKPMIKITMVGAVAEFIAEFRGPNMYKHAYLFATRNKKLLFS